MSSTRTPRAEQHNVKLDQVPRWSEADAAITPDAVRSNLDGSHGEQHPSEPGRESGPSDVDQPSRSDSETGDPLGLSPLKTQLRNQTGMSNSGNSQPGLSQSLSGVSHSSHSHSHSHALTQTQGLEAFASGPWETHLHNTQSSSFLDPLTNKLKLTSSCPTGAPRGGPPAVRFPVNEGVNSKVLLWRGDPWNLEVDAVVNSTNESLEESASSPNLHLEAGPELAEECAALGQCRTGEVKVTGGFALPARQILHTVSPRYSAKYHTAAENALSSCYRTSLEVLVELELHSIAFGCLYTESKGYPREQAAHVAIRTVRRFLERHGGRVTAVVFCVQSNLDNDIYKRLLPLYFPRTKAEEGAAQKRLPEDTGDETGGASTRERMIKIHPGFLGNMPGTPCSTSSMGSGAPWVDAQGEPLDSREFLSVAKDPDLRRQEQWSKSAAAQANGFAMLHLLGLEGLVGPNVTIGEEFVLHQKYLAHASKLDFTQLSEMKILCRGGVDLRGRQVIAVVGAHFLPRCIDLESFVLYVIKELDAVMHRPFCVVYYHSLVHLPALPNFAWMAKLHHILGPRHRRNLQSIYVVHPTVGLRTAVWALQAFVDPVVWKKVVYISRLVDLFRFVPRDQVTVPEFIIMHDIELNPMDAISISYQAHNSMFPRGVFLSRDF